MSGIAAGDCDCDGNQLGRPWRVRRSFVRPTPTATASATTRRLRAARTDACLLLRCGSATEDDGRHATSAHVAVAEARPGVAYPLDCGGVSCRGRRWDGVPLLRPDARCHGPDECGVWERPGEPCWSNTAGWRVQQPVHQLLERSWHQPLRSCRLCSLTLADDSYATIGLVRPCVDVGHCSVLRTPRLWRTRPRRSRLTSRLLARRIWTSTTLTGCVMVRAEHSGQWSARHGSRAHHASHHGGRIQAKSTTGFPFEWVQTRFKSALSLMALARLETIQQRTPVGAPTKMQTTTMPMPSTTMGRVWTAGCTDSAACNCQRGCRHRRRFLC